MAVRVEVGEGYRIAVPEEVRDKLRIERDDRLLVEVRDGYALLVPEPRDYVDRLAGLHSEIWEGVDPQDYVRRERDVRER